MAGLKMLCPACRETFMFKSSWQGRMTQCPRCSVAVQLPGTPPKYPVEAVLSFFIPGLGQILQGRLIAGPLMFVLGLILATLYLTFLLAWVPLLYQILVAIDAYNGQ